MTQYNVEFTVKPIGYVENSCNELLDPDTLRALESRIVLNPELTAGLSGLEEREKILIVFYFDRLAGESFELLQHRRGQADQPIRGVFALRSPRRPNHIGVTEADLLEIRGNVLRVRGLDAVNGTPVLDIKPVRK